VGLILRGKDGTRSASLTFDDEDGQPYLTLSDSNGNARALLSIGTEGSPYLTLLDKN